MMINSVSKDDERCLRLSELIEARSLPRTACAQYPGHHCSFKEVAGNVTLIKNSFALLLGPAICLYNAKLSMSLRSLTSDPRPDNLLFLEYTQDDVIFGFNKKIRETILEVDRIYHPELLFIVTTCLQEIVGEDLEASIDEIRHGVGARLLVIHTENFITEDTAPGIENFFSSLFNIMEPREVETGTVNIMGLWTNHIQETEMAHLLKSKGIEIKTAIPSPCTPSDIAGSPGAELNIVMDQYALPLAMKMKETFGTGYIYSRKPYYPESIETWYRNIALVMNMDLEEEIRILRSESQDALARSRSIISGKSCAISWNTGRTFDLARLLLDLGMNVKVILAHNILPGDIDDIKEILASGADPLVFRGDNIIPTERLLSRLKPDIYVGDQDQRSLASLGIQAMSLSASFSLFGFQCCNEVLRTICKKPAGIDALMYKEKLLKLGSA